MDHTGLDERPTADPGRDVQVREQADAVGPGVGGEPAVAGEGQLADRAGPQHPAGQDHVRLVDVERIGIERRQRLGKRASHLAAGDPDARRRGAQRREPSQIRAGKRLFQPQHVVRRELSRDVPGGDRVQGGRRVAGHPPALVEIDHERHGVTHRVAGGGDRGEPFVQVPRIDPDLHRAEPFLEEAQGGFARAAAGIGVPHEA